MRENADHATSDDLTGRGTTERLFIVGRVGHAFANKEVACTEQTGWSAFSGCIVSIYPFRSCDLPERDRLFKVTASLTESVDDLGGNDWASGVGDHIQLNFDGEKASGHGTHAPDELWMLVDAPPMGRDRRTGLRAKTH